MGNKTDHQPARITNELKTIKAMITIYCNDNHRTKNSLCPECSALLEYAEKRLACCPFQENKPTCGKCTVHCYKPGMRDLICSVMRHSGPKMIYKHPIMAIKHLIDGLRKAPRSGKEQ